LRTDSHEIRARSHGNRRARELVCTVAWQSHGNRTAWRKRASAGGPATDCAAVAA
jgi:hypothetical protein